ncbi:MAG: FAD-dependent oxidoreductase, partial [Pseudomonadota bacterium]|nr:FAD-dependent oxidoreductase [Pseudomonadota bacterium]
MNHASTKRRHHVVIVGGGFGGLAAARRLGSADVDVTLIDRTNHHLFQPLLYQVATGILSEGDIAPPLRDVLRDQQNATVVLGDVVAVDLGARRLAVKMLERRSEIAYDSLIVATGASQSYFGHPEFAHDAPGMKTIDDALELRGRILGAFEMAEREPDPAERRRFLTFVVVGAGPTGVEVAGQLAELSRHTLRRNFRRIDPAEARIVLLDAAPTVLGAFPESLRQRAMRDLLDIGVEV